MSEPLRAPFPYFGGKAMVADLVWEALGNPAHYIEPFFGSGAVLLARPERDWPDAIETVNDKDGFVANVWRSLKFSPDEVAEWCDWPVNHADLMARKAALLRNEANLLENLVRDDLWHDAKMAGYWIWAASCWIGIGLTSPGQIPHLGTAGAGVHRIGASPIHDWLNALSLRLRRVRVVCGDWTRVCGGNWQDKMGMCGMFFDPPYADPDRDSVYHHDCFEVARKVEDWVLERGSDPNYRIVVAGYDSEYRRLKDNGWREHKWKAKGGYGNVARQEVTQGKINRHREVLLFSPHCLEPSQRGLFDALSEAAE